MQPPLTSLLSSQPLLVAKNQFLQYKKVAGHWALGNDPLKDKSFLLGHSDGLNEEPFPTKAQGAKGRCCGAELQRPACGLKKMCTQPGKAISREGSFLTNQIMPLIWAPLPT